MPYTSFMATCNSVCDRVTRRRRFSRPCQASAAWMISRAPNAPTTAVAYERIMAVRRCADDAWESIARAASRDAAADSRDPEAAVFPPAPTRPRERSARAPAPVRWSSHSRAVRTSRESTAMAREASSIRSPIKNGPATMAEPENKRPPSGGQSNTCRLVQYRESPIGIPANHVRILWGIQCVVCVLGSLLEPSVFGPREPKHDQRFAHLLLDLLYVGIPSECRRHKLDRSEPGAKRPSTSICFPQLLPH